MGDTVPFDLLVHSLHGSSTEDDYDENCIKLEYVEGKGRGYIATKSIASGTLVHRSSGYICSPTRDPPSFIEKVPFEKRTSVQMLSHFLDQLENPEYPSVALHPLLRSTVLNELQPKNLEEWNGSQIGESKLIAELYCKATNRDLSEIDEIARIGLIAVVNSHQVQDGLNTETNDDWGIFPSASFFNHSCWPNCCAFYSKEKSMYLYYLLIYITKF